MRYKTVLFDWGGVISSGGAPDEMPSRLGNALGIEPDKLRPFLRTLTSQLKIGSLTIEDFWDRIETKTKTQVPLARRDIWATLEELKPDESLVHFTEYLKENGYVVAILSNTFPNTAADIDNAGWYKPYTPVFLSSSVGLAKPDTAFYLHALTHLGNKAEEVIFIDDQQKCLTPAGELGMHTILAKHPQQIIADISRELQLEMEH